ncbi:glycosyltransferase [Patescibacteria group bacterium]|nr:glycosyltransferase [Patescibacteria group bacterium]MBU1908331.1 glycosyltransferase [Patescibacteria group bacterium]
MDTISIIIPCFNHAEVLRRTLKGIQDQTLQPNEIVVVDDSSMDNPKAVVSEFVDKLKLKFFRLEKNSGAPAARNYGAERTSGEFLLFLDADVELEPDALETFVNALNEHTDAVFAYSDFFWGSKLFRGLPFDVEALKKRNFIHTSSLLRRVAFPGFDESLKKFQDWDLWLTIAERGGKGVWINRPLYRIKPRRNGMSRWAPRFLYKIPWQKLGFMPKVIREYREAEQIVRKKHRL